MTRSIDGILPGPRDQSFFAVEEKQLQTHLSLGVALMGWENGGWGEKGVGGKWGMGETEVRGMGVGGMRAGGMRVGGNKRLGGMRGWGRD